MRNSLADVIAAALRVLGEQGLEGCSMRRVAAELDVQPSALYHHVPNKQTLLALMADEIVAGVDSAAGAGSGVGAGAGDGVGVADGDGVGVADGAGADAPPAADTTPDEGRSRALCIALRDAMLAVRDGADVVATAAAFRLGASDVERSLAVLAGADGARTLLLYTFGHAQSTQMHRQAAAFGALVESDTASDPAEDLEASFERGLDIILAGLASGR